MSRKLKRIALWVLSGFILLAALGVLLGILYEDEVKQQIVQEVNQSLNAEISVEEISFSVLKKFPYAALHFQNLMALDAIETTAPKDTLLYAESLFLEFNLLDVFTRQYTVRKVDVANAVLRLKVDENGNDNFHFWKERSDTTSAHVGFDLAKVSLTNVDFSYRNVKTEFHLNTQIDRLNLSGNFKEAVFDLDAESELLVQILSIGETEYLRQQSTTFSVLTRIDTRKSRYEIGEGEIDFDGLDFQLSGYFQAGDQQFLDLQLNGEQLDISEILSFIPKRFITRLEGYDPKGETTFGLHLKGDPTNREEPMDIVAEFDVANAGVKHLKSGLQFKDFSATGRYQNRGNHPDIIELDQFRFKLKDGYLGGSGSVRNFSRPMIQFDLNGKAELADLQEIMEIRAVESISGEVILECRFKGIVANPDDLSVKDLQGADISGRLQFANAAFKIRNQEQRYHKLNGEFYLNGNDAAFKNLRGNIHSSDLELDGIFINFVPFVLIEKERLTIQASLRSNYINLAELLASDASAQRDSSFNFRLPQYIDVNVNSEIDRLVFRTFEADNIFGKVEINKNGITADPLTFNTSRGSFTAGMTIKPTAKDQFKVDSHAKFKDIDIRQLFTEFGNFGQQFITDKHLKGTADADVVFRASINNQLKLSEESIYSLIDIEIKNGELIRLQSLTEVADYIRQNKLLSPLVKTDDLKKRLQHVSFSELKNQIEIKNSTVHIPEMSLESSAMNLAVSGTHGFNSVVDYRIRFRLTEILTNPTHTEFGDIEDDGSGGSFFLRMNGPLDNLNFAYDKESAKEQRRKYFKEEKETLKDLLKEEFNIFGKKKKEKEQEAVPEKEKNTSKTIVIAPSEKEDPAKKKKPGILDELDEDDDF